MPDETRTRDASPDLSPISPSKSCSVATELCPNLRASSWASMITLIAFSVNLSNIPVILRLYLRLSNTT
jgi:hypothetical protein